MKAQTDFI